MWISKIGCGIWYENCATVKVNWLCLVNTILLQLQSVDICCAVTWLYDAFVGRVSRVFYEINFYIVPRFFIEGVFCDVCKMCYYVKQSTVTALGEVLQETQCDNKFDIARNRSKLKSMERCIKYCMDRVLILHLFTQKPKIQLRAIKIFSLLQNNC